MKSAICSSGVAVFAGETPSLASQGLDRNVLQRDSSARVRLFSGETSQTDRTSGIAAVVQTEPLASPRCSRHAKIAARRMVPQARRRSPPGRQIL